MDLCLDYGGKRHHFGKMCKKTLINPLARDPPFELTLLDEEELLANGILFGGRLQNSAAAFLWSSNPVRRPARPIPQCPVQEEYIQ